MITDHFLADMPRSTFLLVKNPVYMLLNLGAVFEMIIVTGFLTFVPKYLETQFSLKKSLASIVAGSY